MTSRLPSILCCPRDRSGLTHSDVLTCEQGHVYPIVDGIPVMLVEELPQNYAITESLKLARNPTPDDFDGQGIHPQVQAMVAGTNGILYENVKLTRYPIPPLRMEEGKGKTLLDVGCNWGRWTVSAARKGYRVLGLDPHLHSLRAAQKVAHQLGVEVEFVCGDARMMPFRDESFDRVFSYSVIQHFSKEDARVTINEIKRVLSQGGMSFIQMPNRYGARSLQHQLRRGLKYQTNGFDVRYWTPGELVEAFSVIGDVELSVDGFFGLGIQPSDIDLMPARFRVVIRASEILRKLSLKMPFMVNLADSVYVTARRG